MAIESIHEGESVEQEFGPVSEIEEAIKADPRPEEPRPLRILSEYMRRYPGLDRLAAREHDANSVSETKRVPGKRYWPSWCYLPSAGVGHMVSEVRSTLASSGRTDLLTPESDAGFDSTVLASLLAWRMGKGIYRFDETIFRALCKTPHTGDLPTDVLLRLPEWGAFVEAPIHGNVIGENGGFRMDVSGFFVHIDFDVRTESPSLCLLFDETDSFFPVTIDLSQKTLSEGIRASLDPPEGGEDRIESVTATLTAIVEAFLPMVLYIASANAEIGSFNAAGEPDGDTKRSPEKPKQKKTRKGSKTFAADSPQEWAVGWRTGAALRHIERLSEERERTDWRPPKGTKRGHVRRAHWHTYWIGPRPKEGQEPSPERKRILKWLPPVPVNVGEDDLPAVFHEVE